MSELKQRIDTLLFEKGLAESREKAKSLIMAGVVYIDEQKVDKPGTNVSVNSNIIVRQGAKYVSRGGLKLEKSIENFDISLSDKVCMDIGASTGGFTDCMLQNGAKKVYSVDVGYGQLAWKLRCDDRVCNLERTNIRYLDNSLISDPVEFVSIDVSFISLKLVLPKVKELLISSGDCVALIKPQFEAGREKVGKKGVVRDINVHKEVISNVFSFTRELGFKVVELDYSPIKGPEGNIEYLMHIKKESEIEFSDSLIEDIVEKSHTEL
ncbi:MAG: TlyA family RNA methyltransferase [Ruminococcaceae bacterium]|nr:TlyA family RNA methyltransferase [Oscillospiraceae bacterium]